VPVYETYSTPVVVRQGQFETEAKKQAAIEAARAPIAAMETEKARLQADLQKVTDELARLGVK
jgi:predicted nuclease with TOPRIM domain